MGDVIVWAVVDGSGRLVEWYFSQEIAMARAGRFDVVRYPLGSLSLLTGEEKILERFLDRPGGSARLIGVEAMSRDEKGERENEPRFLPQGQ